MHSEYKDTHRCVFSINSTQFTETTLTLHLNFSMADALYCNDNLNDHFQTEKHTNFYYQLVLSGRKILF